MNERLKHLAIIFNELANSIKPLQDSLNCFDDRRKA